MTVMVELLHIPGCVRCADSREALRETAQAVAGEELIWRDLDVIEHMDYAVTLGVLSLPAVAINGHLVFSSLPTPDQLRRVLAGPPKTHPSHGR
jgi:hypothetical protein